MHENYGSRIDIAEYLLRYKEELPQWLKEYSQGRKLSFSNILSGRVGYYPGSGFDGTLVKVGNMSHTIHSFLYVDYGINKEEMINHLSAPNSIRGYHSIGRIEWTERDILPNGEHPFDIVQYKRQRGKQSSPIFSTESPYCFTEIMERDADYDDSWGAKRFALTLLCADGIATYYQLFCKEYHKAPWIFLLQDHGFGLNYDKFGKGGILDTIIKEFGIRPTFVLCDQPSNIWENYHMIPNINPISRPSIKDERALYRVSI